MNLTPEERTIGKENFHSAIGVTRRDFLMGTVAAGVGSGAGLGAMYFGYEKSVGNPVRVGFIGTGDEGSVLIGAHTPDYLEIKAIADIRPFNIHRAFHGDYSSPNTMAVRPGLMKKYDWKSEDEARKHVKVYGPYEELLDDPDIEAVVIALPLHLHAEAAVKAMRKGKHVLTEKLMGHSVHECKEMARWSQETGKYLATGHQRHYSILYDNAVDTIKHGLLGDLHHIRAQWHRGNLPGKDSWQQPIPLEGHQLKSLGEQVTKLEGSLKKTKDKKTRDELMAKIAQIKAQISDKDVDAAKYGYIEKTLEGYGSTYKYSPLEELIRWRLWERTGGGLMAELGSHQLDAAGIFVSALQNQKALPLSVSAVGGRHIFPLDREVDDHVYCIYEFPAKGYFHDNDRSKGVADPNKKIVVTYSSINGNGFGNYGEVVMGTKGTLILEQETEVMLYAGSATRTSVSVSKSNGGATLDTTQSGGGAPAAVGQLALSGPVSRGYTEEMEHWAWCIRNESEENKPRCHPKVALGDAVIALTTNIVTGRNRNSDAAAGESGSMSFNPAWFDIDSDETPEGVKPDLKREKYNV